MKDTLFLIFSSVIVLFILLLIIKAFLKTKFCVLCLSVGLTWLASLILYKFDLFDNPILTAMLIGNSIVGVYYLVEKGIGERFYVFRLPFFLTLLFAGYFLMTAFDFVGAQFFVTTMLLIFLWLLCGFLYFYRRNAKLKSVVSYIINCCKNW